jgi:hypothetical protein
VVSSGFVPFEEARRLVSQRGERVFLEQALRRRGRSAQRPIA